MYTAVHPIAATRLNTCRQWKQALIFGCFQGMIKKEPQKRSPRFPFTPTTAIPYRQKHTECHRQVLKASSAWQVQRVWGGEGEGCRCFKMLHAFPVGRKLVMHLTVPAVAGDVLNLQPQFQRKVSRRLISLPAGCTLVNGCHRSLHSEWLNRYFLSQSQILAS